MIMMMHCQWHRDAARGAVMLCSLYNNRLLRRLSPPYNSWAQTRGRSRRALTGGVFPWSIRRLGEATGNVFILFPGFTRTGVASVDLNCPHPFNPRSELCTYTRAVSFRRMSQCRLCPPVALQARSCMMMGERPLLSQSAALHLLRRMSRRLGSPSSGRSQHLC